MIWITCKGQKTNHVSTKTYHWSSAALLCSSRWICNTPSFSRRTTRSRMCLFAFWDSLIANAKFRQANARLYFWFLRCCSTTIILRGTRLPHCYASGNCFKSIIFKCFHEYKKHANEGLKMVTRLTQLSQHGGDSLLSSKLSLCVIVRPPMKVE